MDQRPPLAPDRLLHHHRRHRARRHRALLRHALRSARPRAAGHRSPRVIWFWAAYGAIVGTLALGFALDTLIGFRTVAALAARQWDAQPEGNPRLTIVVPAKNEEAAIEACLRSLLALDYPNV